jgi:hypothetical protein
MRRFMTMLLALCALAPAGACGDSGETASGGSGGESAVQRGTCDVGHCTTGEGPSGCVQYADDVSGTGPYELKCANDAGTWAAGGCPERGIGGCRQRKETTCFIQWYPDTFEPEQVSSVCQYGGGTFIEPGAIP